MNHEGRTPNQARTGRPLAGLVWAALAAIGLAGGVARAEPPEVAAPDDPPRFSVTGRIVVDGETPEPRVFAPGRDACCVAAEPVDLSVAVGPDGGLANVVVSVEPRWGEPKPAPPAGDAAPTEPVVLTNAGCAFLPRVAIVRLGQPLLLANDDPTMHNVDARLTGGDRFNLVLEPGGRRELRLAEPQRKPLPVGCNVHPFMRAWLFVRSDPYAAVTDASGRFELPRLPAGEWRLQFWHEGAYLAELAVGDRVTDRRGSLLIRLGDGSHDLGEIRLPAERLVQP